MNVEEFLKPDEPEVTPDATAEETSAAETLDVQKIVVEELAADKAQLDVEMAKIRGLLATREEELFIVRQEKEKAAAELAPVRAEAERLRAEVARLEGEIARLEAREIDLQERNPNALALLDRDVEVPDRFPGESRDHVLEVIAEARAAAEADGRVRRAQVLESVLLANEPNGTLKDRRESLRKLFAENGNLVSGPVLEELQRRGLPHREGETYLLPAEILKRNY